MLQLIQARELVFKLVYLAQTAASVGSQELLAFRLVDTKTVPKTFHSLFQLFQLALPRRLLGDELISSGREALEIFLV
jgi:hypothetical protein